MKMVKQSFEILTEPFNIINMLKRIELAGRTCYKSEDKITTDSTKSFVAMLIKNGHLSVLEHETIQVRLITDRGVTHELVRHRTGIAYSMESTRYCNYGGGDIIFIEPVWYDEVDPKTQVVFMASLMGDEEAYNYLLKNGWRPEMARNVLPNSLKTEIITTANIREWRHIFNLRCSKKAHPQIRELMLDGLKQFHSLIPVIFDDLYEKYINSESK